MSPRVAGHEFDDCPGFYVRPVPEITVGGRLPHVLCSELRYAAEAGLAKPWLEWPAKAWAALGLYVHETAALEREEWETKRTGMARVNTIEDRPGQRVDRRRLGFVSET